MLAAWVVEEMKTVELNDRRLNERLITLLDQLAAKPTASIPAACGGGGAEVMAAYRFFDNDKATYEGIMQPHLEATRLRMAEQQVVLLVQDTTELDLTRPEKQVQGAGLLDGNARRGLLSHVLHAFTPDGTPLGTVQSEPWTRDDDAVTSNSLSRAERAATPIEEKESHRWVVAMQHAQEEARRASATTFICVGDSEADIYELFAQGAADPQMQWLVRGCQNRAVQKDEETAENYVKERVLSQPVLFTQKINVRGRTAQVACETRGRRQPRKSRETEVAVRAASVTLRPPRRPDRKLPPVTVNVVAVAEVNPPADDEPVEWILITTLPIADVEQVREIIQYYVVRWMIEIFFRVLKGGCRVEGRRFEHVDRLLTCLAIYMIVAWRTLFVCRMGRSCPDIDCQAIFEPAEWKSVWKVVHRTDPPRTPPSLGEMVRMVAQLGGYVNRKRDDAPGPQTVWLGLQRMHDMALCWELFGPDSRQDE